MTGQTNPRFHSENKGAMYWVRDIDGCQGYVGSLVSTEQGDFLRFSDPERIGVVQVSGKPNGTLHCRGRPIGFRGVAPNYTFRTADLEPDSLGHIRDTTATAGRRGPLSTPGDNLHKEPV
ncbi:MAG: hypothetical protein ABH864_06320 [archaeon]